MIKSIRKNQSGFAHAALVGLIVILAVVGAGVYVAKHQTKKQNNNETVDPESSLVEALPSDLLTADSVKTLATTQAPDSSPTSVELEKENNVYVYHVKLADGRVLLFDAKTGAAITADTAKARTESESETETETEHAKPEDLPKKIQASITYDQAREIALKQKPGGTIVNISLESADKKVVYRVRFSDEARVFIDGTTGAVTRTTPGKTASENKSKGTEKAEDKKPATPEASHRGSSGSNSSSDDKSEDD